MPAVGAAELKRPTHTKAARAERKPMLTYTENKTLLVFTPDSFAARSFPPIAYKYLPGTVYRVM